MFGYSIANAPRLHFIRTKAGDPKKAYSIEMRLHSSSSQCILGVYKFVAVIYAIALYTLNDCETGHVRLNQLSRCEHESLHQNESFL